MKDYLTAIITAAVFAAVANCFVPDKWQKYLKAVTGIMIVVTIINPVLNFNGNDVFSDTFKIDEIDMNAGKKAVAEQLKQRVESDVEERILTLYGIDSQVSVELVINDNYEIEGVGEMIIWTEKKREEIRETITEIYSPQKISFR